MTGLSVRTSYFSAAKAIEEILVMRFETYFAAHLFDELVARAVHLPAVVFAENHQAFRAVEGVAVFVPFLHVGRPDPMFVDELLFLSTSLVFEGDILRVGELLIVVEEVFSTETRHRVWMRFHSKSPASQIDVVDAVIARIAATKSREPAPGGMQEVRLVRRHRRGANP